MYGRTQLREDNVRTSLLLSLWNINFTCVGNSMVVTFGSQETEPTMLRNKRAACRDGTSADGERNNGVCGAKMPHSTQIEN